MNTQPHDPIPSATDVVVIGGGPAGSTVSTILAQQGRRVQLRVWDPVLCKGSIWTYWKGTHRDAGLDEGATLVLQTDNKHGWFWYIPLHDDRASVGVVAPFDYLFKGRGDLEQTYREEMDRCPAVKGRLAKATRISGCFATKDFSYRSTQTAGDGWVLIGDAFGFLDPLYSSGILLALRSGEMAADAIHEGLTNGDISAAQLGKWGPSFHEGMDRMRRLVCEYYDGFNFGAFVRRYPELRGTVTDLLIGDLFTDRVDKVWGPMESFHEPGTPPFPKWDAGNNRRVLSNREVEIVVPAGPKP